MTVLRARALDAQGKPVQGRKAALEPYTGNRYRNLYLGPSALRGLVATSDSDGWLEWQLPPLERRPGPKGAYWLITGLEDEPVVVATQPGDDAVTLDQKRVGALDVQGNLIAAPAPPVDTSGFEPLDAGSGAKRQSILLGLAMRQLRKKIGTKIVIRGDSTTYGHDTVSADKVAPPTTVLPDGSKHTATRSPKPYPDAMADRLNQVYGGIVTVENQGYSGDWVQRGYTRWLNSVGAHITVISYGINDASASYVPDEYRGNVDAFVQWHEKMLLRDLGWGSAVVFLTSTRQLGASGNIDTDTFRNALYGLAMKYGIPIIDGEQFLLNAARNCWSDGNHLTTKGNGIQGARLAACFVGEGPQHPNPVGPGSKLLGRPTLDNLVLADGAAILNNIGYRTPFDSNTSQGFAVGVGSGADGSAYWSFYTEAADVVVFPLAYVGASTGETGAKIVYELDFNVEQGDNYHDQIINVNQDNNTDLPAPSATVTQGPIVAGGASFFNKAPDASNAIYLRISTPGWHTLRAHATTTAPSGSSAAVHALEFFDWRTWYALRTTTPAAIAAAQAAVRSAYNVGVPAAFNEANDILTTTVNWPDLCAKLGLPSWASDYYRAPTIKLSVRTYAYGFIDYVFVCTQRPDAPGFDISAVAVGAYAIEGPTSIPTVQKLAAIKTGNYATALEANVQVRELATIHYTATGQNLVLTWRTTNSADNTTAKNMKRNSLAQFTAY